MSDALALVCADILDGLGQRAGAATLRWGSPTLIELTDERDALEWERDLALNKVDDYEAEMCVKCKAKTGVVW
jgi:hypothetical protein